MEAQLFARRLKENELIKSGIDVKKLKEQTKNEEINLNPILSKYYESRAESESKLDSEKLKESFTKFEVESLITVFII